MSKTIGLVVEGKTDKILLEAVLERILPESELVIRLLQPSGYGLGHDPSRGEGWPGVMRWCNEVASDHKSLQNMDLIIVQIDADVAEKTYKSANIDEVFLDLPCVKPCPPAQDTVTALEQVIGRWLGGIIPHKLILCIPSKQIESWLVPLFPLNLENLECSHQVYAMLSSKAAGKLVRQSGKKDPSAYQKIAQDLGKKWDLVKRACHQAAVFEQRVLGTI